MRSLLIGASVFALACGPAAPPADLVILGRTWTGVADQPWADGVAVRGERIAAVGTRAEIEALVGENTRVIEAAGMVAPGFGDTHVHFLDGGFGLASVQLRDAATPEEFARRIGEFAAGKPPGTWILNGEWDHTLWGGELPSRDWIDALTPEHPVFVNRLDGHMALANSAALAAAGVDDSATDVEGGEIVRDASGRLTGVFKDNAMGLVYGAIPPPGPAEYDAALQAAMDYVASNGVTSVHHMAASISDLDVFARAHAAGTLRTRIYACAPMAQWQQLRDRLQTQGAGDAWLRFGCLKAYVDGSLGSHTAAFLEPFTDAPGESGLLVSDPAELEAWIAGVDAAGLQANVHAIGDRAIRMLLDIYERVAAANGTRDRRFRIEHAQHIHPDDIGRFGALGVIASMQPYHAIDDGRWADAIIGPERSRTTYAFRSLLDAGAMLAFGSDWAVAPATPLEGIYAAVTRRTLDDANPDGWVPEQKITVQEALRAYTAAAAYASFEEGSKGVLQPGMLADIVVLDADLTAIAPETVRDVRVLATIVGGRVVYEAR